jgi:hypothetical protein
MSQEDRWLKTPSNAPFACQPAPVASPLKNAAEESGEIRLFEAETPLAS